MLLYFFKYFHSIFDSLVEPNLTYLAEFLVSFVRAQNFPRTDFFKTLTAGRK